MSDAHITSTGLCRHRETGKVHRITGMRTNENGDTLLQVDRPNEPGFDEFTPGAHMEKFAPIMEPKLGTKWEAKDGSGRVGQATRGYLRVGDSVALAFGGKSEAWQVDEFFAAFKPFVS